MSSVSASGVGPALQLLAMFSAPLIPLDQQPNVMSGIQQLQHVLARDAASQHRIFDSLFAQFSGLAAQSQQLGRYGLGDMATEEQFQHLAHSLQQAYESKPRPADPTVVQTLDHFQVTESTSPAMDCVICLEPLAVGEDVIRMPCHENHVFHKFCLESWFNGSNKCPMCRWEILTTDEVYNAEHLDVHTVR